MKISQLSLGVVTGIGGFLEAGSIATSAQAGARFGYQLTWAVVIGTAGLIFLTEMSGRLATVSKRALADAIRERFGFPYFMVVLVVGLALSFLVLATEIGGIAIALQMASGISYRVWAFPVAIAGWMFIWRGTFNTVETTCALLGLVSIAFGIAVVMMHPSWTRIAAGAAPTRSHHDTATYWFLVVSIIGASISPYLCFVYSAGAIEEKWDTSRIAGNRIAAILGNAFGGLLAVAVLVLAALSFHPRGIQVTNYAQIAQLMVPAMGHAGFIIFLAILGITCFGATTEIMLGAAYLTAQGFGWEWSQSAKPGDNARFSLVYTLLVLVSAVPLVFGLDVIKLTNVSMALSSASLPVSVLPLLVLMNDRELMGNYCNGWFSNAALILLAMLSIVLLLVAVPLQVLGG